jgi:hypothetical protein
MTKMDKPALQCAPMTKAEFRQFIRQSANDEALDYINEYIEVDRAISRHNFAELKKYYEGMLPDTTVELTHDYGSTIRYTHKEEPVTKEHLDRLIEIRCFL